MSTSRVSKASLSNRGALIIELTPQPCNSFGAGLLMSTKTHSWLCSVLFFPPQSMDPRMYKSSGFLRVSESSGNDRDAKAAPPTILSGSKIFTAWHCFIYRSPSDPSSPAAAQHLRRARKKLHRYCGR